MPPKPSARSLRIRKADSQISAADIDLLFGRIATIAAPAAVSKSVVASGEHSTSTITFLTPDVKKKAKEAFSASPDVNEYIFDDIFDGITILKAPDNIDLDICAVHGLGGNAMDTFQADTKMWLRDLLPGTHPFQTARIMTFGYNSTLFETHSKDRLQNWADYLLRGLEEVRQGAAANRPIIFVCHSLGGIVARKAMIRLSTLPGNYTGIGLAQCGLLFLSTPHSGTTEADYGDFLKSILTTVAGLRNKEIVKELSSFNSSSVEAKELFQHMPLKPPFECLCESSTTRIDLKVFRKNRLLVTQDSAGFLGQTAGTIDNVDHHTICKFETKFANGYSQVTKRLQDLRSKLTAGDPGNQIQPENLPGHPNATPVRAPLEKKSKLYLGPSLRRSPGRFVGREDILQAISTAVQAGETTEKQTLVTLTGVGGIGKTEILLQFAFLNFSHRHVFLCQARPNEGYEVSLNQIATFIGAEVLGDREKLSARQGVWSSMTASERANAFIAWLGEDESRPAIFLVDDIDAVKSMNNLASILPSTAQTIIYTGRDPHMFADPPGDILPLSVEKMDLDETIRLMQRVLKSGRLVGKTPTISEQSLKEIGNLLDGHPLAACRAVQFIGQVLTLEPDEPADVKFIQMFTGLDWEARLAFLDFKPLPGRSIREVFETSLDRLEGGSSTASQLLHIASFLSGPGLNFTRFLRLDRPWISRLKEMLPNINLFTLKPAARLACLGQLENTSSFTRDATDGTLIIPPLWLECLRQRVRHPGRIRILRQIYLLARSSIFLQENEDVVRPFLENCLAIARSFRISEAEIDCSDEDLVTLLQERQVPSALSPILQQCQVIETSLSQEPGFATKEAFSKYLSQITPLLRQFRAFEEGQDWAQSNRDTIGVHVEVYGALIKIVRGNAELSSRLPEYRRAFMKRHQRG